MIQHLIDVLYLVVAAIFGGFAVVTLFKVARMDLRTLLSEPGGHQKASLSRFQLLLFTFVIAGIYLTLCFESGQFLDIPNGVLGLLGISGGSYVISKGISGGGGPGGDGGGKEP